MLQKYNGYKLLKVFLFSPTESFGLRELSRLSKFSPPSVMRYLEDLEKKKLIEIVEKKGMKRYRAILDSQRIGGYTKLAILLELEECGLTDYLWENYSPEAIILYGGFAKGEITEESDVDIFLLGVDVLKTKVDVLEFTDKLGKEIHVMGQKTLKEIPSKEFKNNLINGIVLRGYLKVL